jgi:hypothetical protein
MGPPPGLLTGAVEVDHHHVGALAHLQRPDLRPEPQRPSPRRGSPCGAPSRRAAPWCRRSVWPAGPRAASPPTRRGCCCRARRRRRGPRRCPRAACGRPSPRPTRASSWRSGSAPPACPPSQAPLRCAGLSCTPWAMHHVFAPRSPHVVRGRRRRRGRSAPARPRARAGARLACVCRSAPRARRELRRLSEEPLGARQDEPRRVSRTEAVPPPRRATARQSVVALRAGSRRWSRAAPSGTSSPSSIMVLPDTARSPPSRRASNTASWWRTVPMSRMVVVPPRMQLRDAQVGARAEGVGVVGPLQGPDAAPSARSSSGRSSAMPRKSTWHRCTCACTRPGITAAPRPRRARAAIGAGRVAHRLGHRVGRAHRRDAATRHPQRRPASHDATASQVTRVPPRRSRSIAAMMGRGRGRRQHPIAPCLRGTTTPR